MNYNPYAAPQAPLPTPGSAPYGQPQPWNTSEAVSIAWARFKEATGVLVGAYFIEAIISVIVGQVPTVAILAGGLDQQSGAAIGLRGAAAMVSWALAAYFQVGLTRIWLASVRGEGPRIEMLFSGADRMLPMMGFYFLFGVAVAIGLLLLVVPGVILLIGLSFGHYYVVDSNMGPVDGLKASWAATSGQRGEVFLLMLAGFGLILLGAIMCCVGTLATAPIYFLATAVAYTRLSGNRPAMAPAVPGPAAGYGGQQPPYP